MARKEARLVNILISKVFIKLLWESLRFYWLRNIDLRMSIRYESCCFINRLIWKSLFLKIWLLLFGLFLWIHHIPILLNLLRVLRVLRLVSLSTKSLSLLWKISLFRVVSLVCCLYQSSLRHILRVYSIKLILILSWKMILLRVVSLSNIRLSLIWKISWFRMVNWVCCLLDSRWWHILMASEIILILILCHQMIFFRMNTLRSTSLTYVHLIRKSCFRMHFLIKRILFAARHF